MRARFATKCSSSSLRLMKNDAERMTLTGPPPTRLGPLPEQPVGEDRQRAESEGDPQPLLRGADRESRDV
jgi:hypothetical protein